MQGDQFTVYTAWYIVQIDIQMHILYHFSTLIQIMTITYGDTFQGIRSKMDCTVARHYKIIFI